MLTKEQYTEHFDGFEIIDVVVQNHNRFYFILRAFDDENRDVRIVRVVRENGELVLVQANLFGYDCDDIHGAMAYPEERLIVMDIESNYFVGKKGTQPQIKAQHAGGPLGGAVVRIKSIGDTSTIIATNACDLLMKHEDETWHRLGPKPDTDVFGAEGFVDFDGFALDDVYAANGASLFHFDGERWEKVFDKPVISVGCMGDGYVYITTWTIGTLIVYRGRGKVWEQIYKDKSTDTHANPIRDTVWHDGKVWLGNWSEQYAFKKGKYVKKFPAGMPGGGYLSARDGVMVCASSRSAHWHEEGGGWHTLFEGWKWD